MNLPIGMITLLIIGVLVYFGIAQRILDRMRLTDKQALLFIGAMIVGSFINIPISTSPMIISINVGGALLPALLAFYLIYRANETKERVRAIVSAILVAVVVWLAAKYLPYEPENMFLDPKLLYGLAAGLIAYIAGRSRRSAFVGGVLGIILSDIVNIITLMNAGVAGTAIFGGAGAFDVTVIAGFVGVMIAEVIGETREKMQGGHPHPKGHRPNEAFAEFSDDITNTKEIEKDNSVINDSEIEKVKNTTSEIENSSEKNGGR